jgi:hypothetical protein
MKPQTLLPPSINIGRAAFAIRLVIFVAVIVVLLVGLQVSVALTFLLHNGRAFLAAMAAMLLLVGIIVVVVFFFKRALLPRLHDIGLHGPIGSLVAALWFVPPVNPFLILALLLTPTAFVPDDPQSSRLRSTDGQDRAEKVSP